MKRFAVSLALLVVSGFAGVTFAEPVTLGPPSTVGGVVSGGLDPDFILAFAGTDVSGSVLLITTPNGDGTFTATSGYVAVTSPDFSGILPLYANPDPTGYVTSPSGYFYYDDQLLPLSDPIVTNPGLLFAALPTPGFEINIFSTAPDAYTYYDNTGYNTPITFSIVSIFAASVPLPASFWAGLGLFAVLGVYRFRQRRRLL
jgi:hypothetical protein